MPRRSVPTSQDRKLEWFAQVVKETLIEYLHGLGAPVRDDRVKIDKTDRRRISWLVQRTQEDEGEIHTKEAVLQFYRDADGKCYMRLDLVKDGQYVNKVGITVRIAKSARVREDKDYLDNLVERRINAPRIIALKL